LRRRHLLAAASATVAGPVATTALASSAGAPRRPRPDGTAAASGAAIGPLAASADGRYFARPDGRQVFLAGSHVWTNLQDANGGDPPVPFDHDAYLDLLRSEGHNFIRL
jgi:hypothetical protein